MLNKQRSALNNFRYVKPLTTICVTVGKAKVTSKRFEIELDSHADTYVVGDNCLVVHDHDIPVNV